MATQRKVEVFSAGCPTCQEVVAMVQRLACPSCDISILDMHDLEVVKRAKALGVQSVAINGQLAGCCANRGVDEQALRAAGLGRAVPIALGAMAVGWLESLHVFARFQRAFDVAGGIVFIATGLYLLNAYYFFIDMG